MNTKKIGATISLLLVLSILAGCAAAQNTAPTTDPKTIYTQVAETVQAQITNAAKLTPKVTNTPLPTDIPLPTSTISAPDATANANATKGTPQATLPAGTPGTGVPTLPGGIATNTPQAPTVPDRMLYVSQGVPDGTKFNKGDQFTMSWTIQNVGSTTWDKTYTVRFYGGDRFGVQNFAIPATVKPQGTVKLSVEMTAPNNSGDYTSVWVITNPDGVNFGYFTFVLTVK